MDTRRPSSCRVGEGLSLELVGAEIYQRGVSTFTVVEHFYVEVNGALHEPYLTRTWPARPLRITFPEQSSVRSTAGSASSDEDDGSCPPVRSAPRTCPCDRATNPTGHGRVSSAETSSGRRRRSSKTTPWPTGPPFAPTRTACRLGPPLELRGPCPESSHPC